MTPAKTKGKLVHLEFARGAACIVVIFHHFFLAFVPAFDLNFRHGGLKDTPLYLFINGYGAVVFFFVLSGFVLTLGFYRNPRWESLFGAVIKRLPRLMVPTSISIIAGYLILKFCGNIWKKAAAITGSEWLGGFGAAHFPAHFAPTLFSAVKQCVLLFFLSDDSYYNSNLWTMKNEFYGSLLVFALVALFTLRVFRSSRSMILLHLILLVFFALFKHNFFPFFLGSGLAFLMARREVKFEISNLTTRLLLIGSAICFSTDLWEAANLGSLLLMLSLLGNPRVSRALSGRLCSAIGVASFPLYIVHTLIILSLSSLLFVHLHDAQVSYGLALAAVFLFTVGLTVLFCIPFIALESVWVPWLNATARQITARVFAPVKVDQIG